MTLPEERRSHQAFGRSHEKTRMGLSVRCRQNGATRAPIHAVGARGLPLRAHVEKVEEEVIRQGPGLFGEDAVLGLSSIGAKHAKAAHENRRRESQ
jgi:hypothetical protein